MSKQSTIRNPKSTEPYVPIWVKSNFSFLEGASHPEELVERCRDLDLPALALTDRDGVYGIVKAHVKAQELGIHLIVGSQISVDALPGTIPGAAVVLLVRNKQGYSNLCRLISKGRLRSPKGQSSVSWDEVCTHAPGLIAILTDDTTTPAPGTLAEAFADSLYMALCRHHRPEEIHREPLLRTRARQLGIPMAACTEVLYHRRSRRRLQDVVTCIRHGVTLDTAGRILKPNAEYALTGADEFAALFQDDPESVAHTVEIAQRCDFSLSQLRYRYPSEQLPDGMTSAQVLRRLTLAGARARSGGVIPPDARRQIDKELLLIEELDYCGYFLTMHDIVEFCRDRDILCQGRGSAANSAVCYCLGITAIDPVRMGLLFERFISRERAEPPDIDLDIEHQRREEVIQYVYEKYGRDRAAMVAVVICYRQRSAVREVGKVLALPEAALDRFAKQLDDADDADDAGDNGMAARAGLDLAHGLQGHFMTLVDELRDSPRHLSIHPGGFILGSEPVHDMVPIENGTMENRTVIQWDKTDVETLCLFKVDLLGLGALTHMHKCFDLLRQHHGRDMSLATVPPNDPGTFAMARTGDTVGVFQIESRAQMSMLPRLKPENYYDLVIQISIVRPGPIVGGMVHPYLRRRAGEEAVEYPHPNLEPVLKKTLGIPLFQEQVMQLAMIAADYTPGEADQLRRDMGAWKKTGRLEQHRHKLIGRMVKKGIAPEFAERVYQQISGFGDYGFPESHAASFALIAYCGAWLRYHYLDVFACALLNAQPMGFYSPATIVDDVKRHGVPFSPIDVTRSDWDCTLEEIGRDLHCSPQLGEGRTEQYRSGSISFAVRMGLRYIKGFGDRHRDLIAKARSVGAFTSISDFAVRTGLDRRALTALAEAGAFRSFADNRREALWQAYACPEQAERVERGAAHSSRAELQMEDRDPPLGCRPLDPFSTITWDYHTAAHSTHGHILATLRAELSAQNLPAAAEVTALPDGTFVRYAGIAICRQRPSTGKGVVFMTLEDETGFVNLILWPQINEKYKSTIRTAAFIGVSGEVQSKQGVVHVLAKQFWTPKARQPVPDQP